MRRAITAYMERSSHGFRRRIPGLVRLAYQPGREPVPIDHLVSPLRYDILVRQRYLEVVREQRSLADEDFQAFMELSRQQPYYTWFTRVVVPSGNHPEIVHDEERLAAAFERRVRRSVELHDSFESTGYDTRRPIILRTGRQITPTATGKHLARRHVRGRRLPSARMAAIERGRGARARMYRVHIAPVLTPGTRRPDLSTRCRSAGATTSRSSRPPTPTGSSRARRRCSITSVRPRPIACRSWRG